MLFTVMFIFPDCFPGASRSTEGITYKGITSARDVHFEIVGVHDYKHMLYIIIRTLHTYHYLFIIKLPSTCFRAVTAFSC